MRFFHRLWLVGAVAVLSLSLWVSPVAAIIGGTPDDGDYPNVGIMYMDNLPALAYGLCSGSLLSADEFLVAGHCTAALTFYEKMGWLTKADVFVSFDAQVSYDDTTGLISAAHPIAVTGWDTHPAFGPSAGLMKNDVGVIHLAKRVNRTPIELPEVGFLDARAAAGELVGHDFVIVGYGLNSIDRSMNNAMAQWTWDHTRRVSETAFISLSSNTLHQDADTCGGDSGGPHFWSDDSYLVVAVTSSGSAACGPDASQRLDLQSVLDFLELYR